MKVGVEQGVGQEAGSLWEEVGKERCASGFPKWWKLGEIGKNLQLCRAFCNSKITKRRESGVRSSDSPSLPPPNMKELTERKK